MTTPHDSARGRIAVVTGGAGTIGTTITKALRENRDRGIHQQRSRHIRCSSKGLTMAATSYEAVC